MLCMSRGRACNGLWHTLQKQQGIRSLVVPGTLQGSSAAVFQSKLVMSYALQLCTGPGMYHPQWSLQLQQWHMLKYIICLRQICQSQLSNPWASQQMY